MLKSARKIADFFLSIAFERSVLKAIAPQGGAANATPPFFIFFVNTTLLAVDRHIIPDDKTHINVSDNNTKTEEVSMIADYSFIINTKSFKICI